MKPEPPFNSSIRIFVVAFLLSFFVFGVSLLVQWLVYDDWLRETGPLRIIGTSIAAVVTFGFVVHWQNNVRRRQQEMLRRFEMIAEMNDRIRNALQAIECVTYLSQPEATESVRQSVAAIDVALRGVVADAAQDRVPPAKAKDISSTARRSA
ncbi:MAG TPA: hypothetical protein VJA94_23495 [Candidatus Angelobacter sp.]